LSQYYYLVATLPMLFYQTDRALPREEYLELCRPQVSKADFRVLTEAVLAVRGTPKSGCAVLDRSSCGPAASPSSRTWRRAAS
jgi:hypothetical protein